MLDFVTGLQILLIVLVAMTFFAGVWIIGECFDSWGDFIKSLTDKEYNYLSFVFRKGKHIRFITDFPNDLRRECLGKESYYADKDDDSAGVRKAKMLVRRVLGNDTIVNEYFKGQYFTYKDFLEVKELCDLPEYDETSELLDELASHLKEPIEIANPILNPGHSREYSSNTCIYGAMIKSIEACMGLTEQKNVLSDITSDIMHIKSALETIKKDQVKQNSASVDMMAAIKENVENSDSNYKLIFAMFFFVVIALTMLAVALRLWLR